MKAFLVPSVCAVAVLLSLASAPLARAEDAVLRAKIIDAGNGQVKATFVTTTAIATPPDRRTFSYRRQVGFPRPVGRVSITAEVQFIAVTQKEAWFAINTDAASDGRQAPVVHRVIKARASVPYGKSHTIEDLFSANGSRLSLVITASKQPTGATKPTSVWSRWFGRDKQ